MSAANGSATAGVGAPDDVTGSGEGIVVKPGRHREASLYHALAGAGAGDGRTLAELREAALRAFEDSELPVWRRSGFWTTSFAELDEGLLVPRETTRKHPRDAEACRVRRASAIPDRPRAGRIVQLDSLDRARGARPASLPSAA